MNEYFVNITPEAQQEINEIIQYIRITLNSPQSAASLLEKLKSEIASLAAFPSRIALTTEEPWRSYGIRKLLVKKHLVYFWVEEEAHTVHVTAVIYGGRDQLQQLLGMNLF